MIEGAPPGLHDVEDLHPCALAAEGADPTPERRESGGGRIPRMRWTVLRGTPERVLPWSAGPRRRRPHRATRRVPGSGGREAFPRGPEGRPSPAGGPATDQSPGKLDRPAQGCPGDIAWAPHVPGDPRGLIIPLSPASPAGVPVCVAQDSLGSREAASEIRPAPRACNARRRSNGRVSTRASIHWSVVVRACRRSSSNRARIRLPCRQGGPWWIRLPKTGCRIARSGDEGGSGIGSNRGRPRRFGGATPRAPGDRRCAGPLPALRVGPWRPKCPDLRRGEGWGGRLQCLRDPEDARKGDG